MSGPPTGPSRPAEGDQLAVVSEGGATVSLLDARDHRVRAVLDVTAEPHELCFDPVHRLLWCTTTYHGGYYDANTGRHHVITVIDPDAARIVEVVDITPEHGPHDMALDPVRGLLYVTVEAGPAGPGGVLVLDTATRRVQRRIDTLAPGPHWFAIDRAGLLGYAANKEAPFLSVVELATGTLVDKIAVPGSEGIAAAPDGSTIAVAAPKAGTRTARPGVRLIDTATAGIVRTLHTEGAVRPVHWTSDGLLLAGQIGTGGSGGRLTVWSGPDAASVTPAGELPVGADPLTITSSPDGRRGYVAAVLDSRVHVVDLTDLARLTLLDTVTVPAGPTGTGAHGLAYVPARS